MPQAPRRLQKSFVLLLTLVIVIAGCTSIAFGDTQWDKSNHSPAATLEPLGAFGVQPNQSATGNGTSSDHHVNPSDVNREGELSELSQWYVSHLSSRLGSSTVKIKQGKYEDARSLVGSKYDSKLSQYVDVVGQTKTKRDDRIARELNETQRRQQTYANSVQRYRRLYTQYQQAKRNGNERKARRIARKLNRLQSTIDTTDDELSKNYRNVSNSTGKDFSSQIQSVHGITKNITNQQVDIRRNEFTKTQLVARSSQPGMSYRNPLRVTGELRSRNGTTLSNKTIQLRLTSNHTVNTKTGPDGTFSITGRPRAVHLGNQSFNLRYVPSSDSVYLGTSTNVSATVRQTNATVVLDRSTEMTAFGQRVTATGTVRSTGGAVSSVPVVLFAGGERIALTTTDSNGTFEFDSKLPLNTSAGKQRLRVQLPYHRQALTRAKATSPIRVRETPTSLSLSGSVTQGRNVSVQGRLRTRDGRVVDNQTVTIVAGGKAIGTVQTGANGTYRSQLRIPASVAKNQSNESVMLVARYRDGGSNLGPSRAQTRVRLELSETASLLEQWWLLFVLGAALTSLLIAGAYVWRRKYNSQNQEGVEVTEFEATEEEDRSGEMHPPALHLAFLKRANAALADGDYSRAAELSYAAVRVHVESTTSVEPRLTHWEFYRECTNADLEDGERRSLEIVTKAFERASFTGNAVSNTLASRAVRSAAEIGRTTDTSD
ncbi:COG1361 family protein [Haladaptatus caseinilyticus]|uniref:hypothetical protein n=1 Tax=Haladaptatus caseinilyticus TaxID=2993314 RepID=UPI00224AC0C6|nr:hypothetical protein [Haladaptatus caseinilyticus]